MAEHLTNTAKQAAAFAEAFSAGEAGYLCGILHDIGKYSAAFQRRIRGSGEQTDHATAGAQTAFSQFRNLPAAFCIAGHHGGLPDGGSSRAGEGGTATLAGRMKKQVDDCGAYRTEISVPAADLPRALVADARSAFFFTRMLYSCLVDADYLDTEAFMSNGAVRRGEADPLSELSARLDRYVASWKNAESDLNRMRDTILRALTDAGASAPGLFSLTVPTGGGKTVSSVAFALRHALAHGLRRVIYVIPYTSIIEQTQRVFEGIFGAENVVAHYATVDYPGREDGVADKRRLAAENWDAPIILTTAVQFFESLYGSRPSRCRKLHNIANSVIIFDEAQMMPVPYLTPCVFAIAQLVRHYGCSAVLCTATQPALDRLFAQQLPQGFPIRELCPPLTGMHALFQRVRYEKDGMLTDEELAGRLRAERQVLCIVNSRKQAQTLFGALEGAYHLSTAMYPAHRRRVLDDIRERLKHGEVCRVVSTSLVEAGVDVDFPAVYRALGGLDSMIQAGGRCNREGRRAAAESVVHLFDTEQTPPDMLGQNIAAARRVMREFDDIAAPEAVRAYFEFLYYTLKGESELDREQVMRAMEQPTMPFASVADAFHIIGNGEITVFIPLDEGAALIEQLRAYGPSRGLMRALGQYAVGIHPKYCDKLVDCGAAERLGEDAAVLRDLSLYDAQMGLIMDANLEKNYII